MSEQHSELAELADSNQHSEHDDKGFSEEKCVRCGWVMGQPPLNCQNDDTPHRFPSQDSLIEQLEAMRSALGDIHDLLGASSLAEDQQTVTQAWGMARRALEAADSNPASRSDDA